MFEDSSTYNLLTSLPSEPVWCVIRVLPNNSFAAVANSSIVSKILTPPALPLPPAWICAFKTYLSVFNDFTFSNKSSTVKALWEAASKIDPDLSK